MPTCTRQLLLSPLLLLASACTIDAPLGEDPPGSFRVVVDTPAHLRDQVDLLFVIDNSQNMAERQRQLSQSFSQVFEHLSFGRGQPDMHIGVVATDIGIGEFGGAATGCTAQGHGGSLESPAVRGCAISSESYLEVQRDVDGSVLTNFEGSLNDTFACMAELGENGCEYEQPLQGMRSALDKSIEQNLGFLRPDAVLGVVVLTDEDDCSTYNPALFDPENPQFRGDDPNFRCFQTGVICDGDDVYKPGMRNDCRPRDNSEHVTAVDTYVDYLRALKPNPQDLVVTAIIGDPENVYVEADDDGADAQLTPSCQDTQGTAAYPGIRLSAFVDAFADSGELSSLCDAGPARGLKGMLHNLRQSMGTTCLEGPVSDVDDQAPGRQVDCLVYETETGSSAPATFLPACDRPGDLLRSTQLPCYTIQTGGEACGDFRTQLALQVHGRDAAPSMETRLIAACRVDE